MLALNLEKIELPNQLVAVLADPLLQKFLQLRPEAESYTRINNWLAACISDAEAGDVESDELMDLVEVINGYVQYTKVRSPIAPVSPQMGLTDVSSYQSLPPMLLSLFRVLFRRWDGSDRRDTVLDTISYVPLSNFDGQSLCSSNPLLLPP